MNTSSVRYYTPNIKITLKNGILSICDDMVCIKTSRQAITCHEVNNAIRELINSNDIRAFCKKIGTPFDFFSNSNDSLRDTLPALRDDIFIEFSNLNTEDEIINFISYYGFLGLHIETHKKAIEKLPPLPVQPLVEYCITGYSEGIDEIREEIKKVKCIIDTFDRYNKLHKKGLMDKNNLSNEDFIELCDLDSTIDEMLIILNDVISKVSQQAYWDGEKLNSSWKCSTLLQVIYISLFEKLIGHLLPKNCIECGRSFLPNRSDQDYCQHDTLRPCKEKAKQRRFIENRKRKALKEN